MKKWTKARLAKFRRTMKNKKKEIQSNAFMSKKKVIRPNSKKDLRESEERNTQLNQSVEYLRKELYDLRKRADEDRLNLTKDIRARDVLLFNMRHEDQFDSKLNLNIEKAVMSTNEKFAGEAKKETPDNDLADKLDFQPTTADPTNPTHYKSHPSGIECIQVIRHMNFNRGNAIKYIWRAGLKNDEIHDLAKAVWYLKDEIQRLKKEKLNE